MAKVYNMGQDFSNDYYKISIQVHAHLLYPTCMTPVLIATLVVIIICIINHSNAMKNAAGTNSRFFLFFFFVFCFFLRKCYKTMVSSYINNYYFDVHKNTHA